MTRPVIALVGMTHLGLNSAAAAAERGFEVTAVDPDRALIADIEAGHLPVTEPGLPEMLEKNRQRLTFTADFSRLAQCDVAYVAPDVPTDETGASDLGPLRRLIGQTAAALPPYAVLVILSQVPPGFTRALKTGRDAARLYYQVETLVFGQAVQRALEPERFIVGCADPAEALPPAYQTFLDAFGCPVLRMRYESAELAKIAINCCLVASISVANTLAELCERLAADWSEIAPALRLDRRIGKHAYLAPGLGIAGGNLERDLATIVSQADALGTEAGVIRAFLANSRHRRDWALRTLYDTVLTKAERPVIAVLGLAYKAGAHSTRNSPSLRLLADLAPYVVRAHDPVVTDPGLSRPGLTLCDSPEQAAEGADAVVVMTPWPDYKQVDVNRLAKVMRGKVVIDPYGHLDEAACRAAGFAYHRLGKAVPLPS